MQQEFWQQKWQNNDIGFHKNSVNYFLQRYYHQFTLPPQVTALVPLCGKSLDMLWLAAQGAQVVACDLSILACEQFMHENNLTYTLSTHTGFTCYQHAHITLYAGNFFKFTGAGVKFDFCYDRAALVALSAESRLKYVAHVTSLLKPGAIYLLESKYYSADKTIGPPFSLTDQDIRELYSPNFHIEFLEAQQESITAASALAKSSIRELVNSAYLLTHK